MNRRWLQVRRWWVERQHHLSRAFTIKHARTGRQETYVVCVDCGLEYEYDLATMRITGRPMTRPAEQPDAVALERAWQDQPKPAAVDERSAEEVLGGRLHFARTRGKTKWR
jgi:hypothetical protein